MHGSVLIVEDESLVALDLKMRLTQLGLDVVGVARTSSDALALVEENHPDVVLMDVQIAGAIDGIDTAQEIRRRFGVPSVFVTAYSDGPSIDRAKRTEAYGYLLKPFQDRELSITLEFALFKREAERESERTRALLRATLDTLVEGVAVTDAQGDIILVNDSALDLCATTRAAAGGRPADEVVRVRAPRDGELPALEAHPTRWAVLSRGDNDEIPVELLRTPLDERAGLAGGEVVTLRSLELINRHNAELLAARLAAEAAATAKAEFLARLTHELRTPLNNIVGMSELVRGVSGPPALPYLAILERGARALGTLIDDLLAYASLGEGGFAVENHPFDPTDEIENVVLTYALEAHERGLRCSLAIDPHMPTQVHGDRNAIEKSLRILMSNAVKYTEAGHVAVSASIRSDEARRTWLEIFVDDTGRGVEPGQRERIFEPFIQTDHYATRREGGVGLGLALARRLVDRAQGELRYMERGNEGSRFVLALPVTIDERAVSIIEGYGVVIGADSVPRRVLTTDALLRDVLQPWVQEAGGDVETVERSQLSRQIGATDLVVVPTGEESAVPGFVAADHCIVVERRTARGDIAGRSTTRSAYFTTEPLETRAIAAILGAPDPRGLVVLRGERSSVAARPAVDQASDHGGARFADVRSALRAGQLERAGDMLRAQRGAAESKEHRDVLFRAVLASGRGDAERVEAILDEIEGNTGDT